MSNHTRSEILIWIGFAASFFFAFLIMSAISGELTPDQIGAAFTIGMAVGYINHGIVDRNKSLIFMGALSLTVILVSLGFAPKYFPLGLIILGCGLAGSGFIDGSRTESFAGICITIGGIIHLLSSFIPEFYEIMYEGAAVWLIWMVLVGLLFINISRETKNLATYYLGISLILVSVVTHTFYPEILFISVGVVFFVGMCVNFVYLYRLLGRTPKIGEIFSFAARALFLHGLKKPIDQYNVLAILIKGNIGAETIIQDLMSRLEPRCAPILLLGPTAPTQLSFPQNAAVGWVTTVSGVSDLEYPTLSPEDPTSVSIFLNKNLKSIPDNMNPVVIGDFLDNMIPHMDKGLFYKYYADLASSARVLNHTVVFIVKADIHSEADINVVKRFADVIIENREREKEGKLMKEVRVSNQVDNIHTDWERY
jgi:hypothetical protein